MRAPETRKPTVPALAAAILLAAVTSATPETGAGRVGEWELVWRHSETEGYQNAFREKVGNDAAFPFAWRRLGGIRGDRLAFFDADGILSGEVFLEEGQEAIASQDGAVWIAWNGALRYYERAEDAPVWEAAAAGEPVMLAPDGSLLVLATRIERLDRFRRVAREGGGELLVVGSAGEVRAELPIYPGFALLTGDERRIAFLTEGQLVVVARDGLLEWERRVPIDNVVSRRGVVQLATADGIVVVCGTGTTSGAGNALHTEREGVVVVFDDDGRELWRRAQPESGELWFQISTAASPDGGTVVTAYSPPRFVGVQARDGKTGELLWKQRTRRRPGFRALSVARQGSRVALAQCGSRTNLTVWDSEGTVVWEGAIPYGSRSAELCGGDLLVAEHWIVKLGGWGGE